MIRHRIDCGVHRDDTKYDDTGKDVANSECNIEDDTKYTKPEESQQLGLGRSPVLRSRGRKDTLASRAGAYMTYHCAYIEKFIDWNSETRSDLREHRSCLDLPSFIDGILSYSRPCKLR